MMNKIILSFSALLSVLVLAGCGAPEPVDPAESQGREAVDQMPAGNSGVVVPVEDGCAEACENYVKQCLYLVPNADDYVFDQGRESCIEECADWEAEKVECMQEAQTCASMTDICEL